MAERNSPSTGPSFPVPGGVFSPYFSMSRPASPSAAPIPIQTAQPPQVLPLIAGPVEDLQRQTIPVTLVFELPIEDHVSTGFSPVLTHPMISAFSRGRVSCRFDGPYSLELFITPSGNNPPFASGVVAFRGAKRTHEVGLPAMLQYQGSALVKATSLVGAPIPIHMPPGLNKDALVASVIGARPNILWNVSFQNVGIAYLRLHGTVVPSGYGELDF
jgi:hypothetical protein